MRRNRFSRGVILMAVAAMGTATQSSWADPLRMVPFHQVKVDDQLWRPRIQMLVRDTLPHAFKQTEVAQRRLRLCAEYLESGGTTEKPEPHRFNDSDLYKVMEGAALMIRSEPNAAIEADMDRIIDVIARAQGKDGYLYIPHLTNSIIESEMGPRPYSYELHSHELYNIGHLYEAAVAYAQATGKTKLLEVAEKSATHVNKVFFEGDPNYNDGKPVMQAPGHQEIEIALVKLYEYTGNELYLTMAKRFLDIRGVTYKPNGQGTDSETYAQQHAPVAQQTEAVGHAVRATYMYAAMAEVDSLTGERAYTKALDAIWHDIVDRKMHLTGGLGAVPHIEGFGPAYELPNKQTYLETCAAVGNVFFNMRMFLAERDAKYLDVAEVSLLNNCLAGVGLEGTTFFYPNPLEADDGHGPRSQWFGTACCPSNIARLIPQVPGLLYASDGSDLFCALYAQSQTNVKVAGTDVALRQETGYPFDGTIKLAVEPTTATAFKLHLRIPTWAQDEQFVPGELYHYRAKQPANWTVAVNGKPVESKLEKGFAVVDRRWQKGDAVTLTLPMPVKVTTSIDKVQANHGRVAFTRGPLVLCAEGIDNGGFVQRFFVDAAQVESSARVTTIADGKLKGLPRVTVPARSLEPRDEVKEEMLTLVPYFAWSNRDRGSMITWLPTDRSGASVNPLDPSLQKFATASASYTSDGDTTDALRIRSDPKSSHDQSIRRWTSWPERGREQWVELGFEEARAIRSVGVYWYDDKGGVQVPAKWRIDVQRDGEWRPLKIYNTDAYSVLPDTYNTVHPADALTTDRFRIVMKPKSDAAVGLLSVDVE